MAGEVTWHQLTPGQRKWLRRFEEGGWEPFYPRETFCCDRLYAMKLVRWQKDDSEAGGRTSLTDLGRAVLAQREEADRG